MGFDEKIEQLKEKIENALLPLIDSDYVLWDCPYHNNIGDILIWQGEIEFLQELKYKCLDYASKDTCRFPKLSEEVVILLHGGGNFGDLWQEHQAFRLKIIQAYPNNRIIIFPQTVYYQDEVMMRQDVQIMAEHDNLIICARDQKSYEILKKYFVNTILLLPDMAFCISYKTLGRWEKIPEQKTLVVKRGDKESVNISSLLERLSGVYEIRDWPSMEHQSLILKLFWKLCRLQIRLIKYRISFFVGTILGKCVDICMLYGVKRGLIRKGVCFLTAYQTIYTTRLHVMILAVLLRKPIILLDNSYGKNYSFYETWLYDLSEVKRIDI